MPSTEEPKRVIWLTPRQRRELWKLIDEELADNQECPHRRLFIAVLEELSFAANKERISGRLIANYATGLMLPHDAVPVRVTDEQADALLGLKIRNKRTVRVLQPGPLRRGRR